MTKYINKTLLVLIAIVYCSLGYTVAAKAETSELNAEIEQLIEMYDEGPEATRCMATGVICKDDEVKRVPVEKPPKAFEKSAIKRKLKDGTMQEFDGEKYKIVRRTKRVKKKAKPEPTPTPIVIERKVHLKNRVGILLGTGPLGNIKEDDNAFRRGFSTERGAVLGLEAQRDFFHREDYSIYLGVQIQTNKTAAVKAGLAF